jgi:hypothetical protein
MVKVFFDASLAPPAKRGTAISTTSAAATNQIRDLFIRTSCDI